MVSIADGTLIARAEEEWVCGWCCTRQFKAIDADDCVLYWLRLAECCTHHGNNCCAPGCCNKAYKVVRV